MESKIEKIKINPSCKENRSNDCRVDAWNYLKGRVDDVVLSLLKNREAQHPCLDFASKFIVFRCFGTLLMNIHLIIRLKKNL